MLGAWLEGHDDLERQGTQQQPLQTAPPPDPDLTLGVGLRRPTCTQLSSYLEQRSQLAVSGLDTGAQQMHEAEARP